MALNNPKNPSHLGWASYVSIGNWSGALLVSNVPWFDGTAIHEIGHAWGLEHSQLYYKNKDSINTVSEYLDQWSVMGGNGNSTYFNAIEKENLGWLDSSSALIIDKSGEYEIKNYRNKYGIRYAKVKYDDVPNHYLYLKYRDGLGADSTLKYLFGPGGNYYKGKRGLFIRVKYDYFSFYDIHNRWNPHLSFGHSIAINPKSQKKDIFYNNTYYDYSLKAADNTVYQDSVYKFIIGPVLSVNDSTIKFKVSYFGKSLPIINLLLPNDKARYDFGNYIEMKWGSMPGANNYQIQISVSEYFDTHFIRNIDMGYVNSIIKDTFITSNTFTLKLSKEYYKNNICFWRVRYQHNNGEYSAWSQPNSIILNSITNVENENIFPADYSLSQNFPNPFNPTTIIQYAIAKESKVKIIIYDILGREVTKLVDEINSVGLHSASWNANGYSSGVYFYKIEATPINGDKTFREAKKMLLIK